MTAPAALPERTPPRHGAWRSRLALTLVVSTMGLLALITLAPTLGRLAAARLATGQLATPVEIAWLGLEFDPLAITVSGIALGPASGPRAAAVRVGLDPIRLWRGDSALREIVIEGLRLHAEVGKHGFVVAGINPLFSASAGAPPVATSDTGATRRNRAGAPPIKLIDARLVLHFPERDPVTLDVSFDRLKLRAGPARGPGPLVALVAHALGAAAVPRVAADRGAALATALAGAGFPPEPLPPATPTGDDPPGKASGSSVELHPAERTTPAPLGSTAPPD